MIPKISGITDDETLPLSQSFIYTVYYSTIPEVEPDGTVAFNGYNYNAYDICCLKAQLYVFLKNYSRLIEPRFMLRAYDEIKKMVLTVELHYEAEQLPLIPQFRDYLQGVVNDFIQNYRHFLVIYDNELDNQYPSDWSCDMLDSIDWDPEMFIIYGSNNSLTIMMDVRDQFQKERDAKVDIPPDLELFLDADDDFWTKNVYTDRIDVVGGDPDDPFVIFKDESANLSHTGFYTIDEVQSDFTEVRDHWTKVIDSILEYLYEQGSVKCDVDFAKQWELYPISWKAFTKDIIGNYSTYSMKPTFTLNKNQMTMLVDQILPAYDYHGVYLATWEKPWKMQKTEFLRDRLSGNNILSLPIQDNYASYYYWVKTLKERRIYNGDVYISRYHWIFDLTYLNYDGTNRRKIEYIWKMWNKNLYENTGQVSFLKYSYKDEVERCVTYLKNSDFDITDGVQTSKREAIFFRNDDPLRPWTLIFNIAEFENPNLINGSFRSKLSSLLTSKAVKA